MVAIQERLRASKGARSRIPEIGFIVICTGAAALLLLILLLMIIKMAQASAPAWKSHPGRLFVGTDWNPTANKFGGLPFIYGTIITSVIAVLLAVPVAIGGALFITEIASRRVRVIVAPLIDLLAAVPSVVYGLWGIYVLIPTMRGTQHWLAAHVGGIFREPAPGPSYLAAGVVLAIMIIPTISAVSREVFLKVPRDQREAAYALGATRWEMIRTSVLPPSRVGVSGAIILGLGRALGETIAVAMVIGGSTFLTSSLTSVGSSVASQIAISFPEAGVAERPALIALGLILFGITLLVNIVARLIVRRGRVS
ncbi:MAG: phosphate ABC transporter permease subunit PstC [Actinomycetota bacterium]